MTPLYQGICGSVWRTPVEGPRERVTDRAAMALRDALRDAHRRLCRNTEAHPPATANIADWLDQALSDAVGQRENLGEKRA